ncbi:hypothetical protein FRC96_20150 [Lujinxingia vulgaris]|uniref:Membrane dipeptidase n=1 Tax=Lujinxingia vulgaris TaxID=2600176 RepID=A0A5C6X1P0_9DELT|nr:membrane dipeptidase [Lujinxingia vulgaris]TXD31787.1 hypothetical protein FRC96_20150 [Lujinxingia vulgaris]
MGILDLHVDSIIQQRLFGYDLRKKHRRGIGGQPLFWHADVPRMIEGGYSGACLGIHYWPVEREAGWQELKKQIAYLDGLCADDDRVERVWGAAGWAASGARPARLGLGPGVEGAHMLNAKIERVRELAQMGVGYLTLTHFSANSAATPSMGRGANERDGLTAFGRRLVEELNRYGVVVDLAHVNNPCVLDACAASQAPVMCTHTGAKGVFEHPRNISDRAIDAIAETGGVMGVIFAPRYLSGRWRATTEVALDHLDYFVQRVGVEHVALGSDYDGWLPTILADHHDCRDIQTMIEGMRRRGYDDDAIEKISEGNARRVFAEAARRASEAPEHAGATA